MKKGFFKLFNPETSAKWMKIPTGYTNYKNGKLPRKVSLRDRFENEWPVQVTKNKKDIYFHHGWEKFIGNNTLEYGDFLIFDYDGKGIFDFKLLGINGCVKNGVGGKMKEEEMNVQHQKSVKTIGKTWPSDSNNSSSCDDCDYIVKEEDTNKDIENKEEEETHERVLCSKRKYVEEEEDEEKEEERAEKETEEMDDEKEIESAATCKKKVQRSKAGYQNATACKVRGITDQYGADIFRSGHVTQPKNPYFVAKIHAKRRGQLYIPMDVVRDYQLELPPRITIRDSVGREFETRVNKWNDGRVWLVGGWYHLCKWNLMEKNDRCICEFVRDKSNKGIYLKVQVLPEGSSSHPNNK